MYIVYKYNGNGGVNKGKLYVNLIAKSTIKLKVKIIVNVLSKNENSFTPFWLKNLNGEKL